MTMEREFDFDLDTTVGEILVIMNEMRAGVLKFTGTDDDEQPVFSVICVRGPEETQEIIAAVEQIEDGWAQAKRRNYRRVSGVASDGE
jgi:hypothetical protein